jgi:uncharacterized membrane protein
MHVLRAVQVSEGGLIAEENKAGVGNEEGRLIGGEVPISVVDALEEMNSFRPLGLDERPATRPDWTTILGYDGGGPREFAGFTNTAPYPPLAYLPSILAIFFGKLFGLPVVIWVYLGRALNLLATGAMMVLALRITPVARWVFFGVAALPGMIGQLSAFGADGMTFATCFLTTAYILRLAFQKRRVTAWQTVALAGLGVAVALVKPSYLPLGLLLLLIPILNRHGAAGRRWLCTSLAAVPAVVVALVWLGATAFIDIGVNPANDASAQKAFVLRSPLAFAKAMWNTFILDYPSGVSVGSGSIYREIFGSFASLQAPVPMVFVLLLMAALTLTVFLRSSHDNSFVPVAGRGILSRGIVIATALLTVVATAAALYLYFTPTFGTSVQGLQGRYFLPELLLILIGFSGANRLARQNGPKGFVVLVLAVSLVAAACVTYNRFWTALPPSTYF